MALNKNDIVRLEITGMSNDGNGVGRHEGMAVFVPFTLIDDIIDCKLVKIKSSYAFGIVAKLIQSSPNRCDANCDVFKKCGGCSFCHMTYAEELKVKQDFVSSSFKRIGKLEVEWDRILGCEKTENYRNKAQYPVSEKDGKLFCGFYSKRSHNVVNYLDCSLQPKVFKNITSEIINWCQKNSIKAYNELTNKGLLRHIYLRKGEYSNKIMVCLVVTDITGANFKSFGKYISNKFSDIKSVIINLNNKKTNVILGDKCTTVFGDDYIQDEMCGKKFKISPLSFYQVNTLQAEKLYNIAKEYANLKEGESLLDLYCGIGTIGLSIVSSSNKLIGVEIIPQAIENAKENAKLNNADNAEFICGDAGEIASILIKRGETPDVIIADPARKGCDELSIESILRMAPKRIVMISCNHATAARDCKILCDNGYKIDKGVAVDLFPRTTHVECVVLMSRVKN
ncbi:MAG: 23S rRNA (uracil(1939)-C(5))-methyltransferase RlmD [Clostridiales bacterium]|nr:23S rRNA (uracil(1939)-C(5))-methyltransferase RlmD [Clostridiales bacterium]